jgi:N-acetylglucosaminyl-diphospho-decaprenol L-rhamnosyltransferase
MSARHAAPVTIAIVSWNTRELLARCLRSVADEVREGRAEVWVVDNGSTDGSREIVRERAPWARLLEPEVNLGFGSAVSLVAMESESEWLACANADVALEPDALGALLQAASDERVGCVAPRLLLPGGSSQYSLHSLPTIPFTLALNLGLHRLNGRLRERMLIPGLYDLERPRDVPWAIGAFLLLRRKAFDAVGGFDDRQWLYAGLGVDHALRTRGARPASVGGCDRPGLRR